jgi:excisionase family DNA binding protein
MADAFVTIAEIADLFGVKPRTVRQWINGGELSAEWVDRRRVRMRSCDIEALLAPDPGQARTRLAEDEDTRTPVARFFLHKDGRWRWTMFAAGPLLWLLAVIGSADIGGLLR